jgi:hypothetical protein
LSVLGIRHIDTPCTPYRVWQAIEDAKPSAEPSTQPPGAKDAMGRIVADA